jgi:hypothetical protein
MGKASDGSKADWLAGAVFRNKRENNHIGVPSFILPGAPGFSLAYPITRTNKGAHYPKDYFICKTLSALPSAKICRAATLAAAPTLIIIGLRLAGGHSRPVRVAFAASTMGIVAELPLLGRRRKMIAALPMPNLLGVHRDVQDGLEAR